MAQAPVNPPTPVNTGLQWLTQNDPKAQASANAFIAGNFVRLQGTGSSQTLVKCTDAATNIPCYGIVQRDALASTAEPYLTPTGTTHTPISMSNTRVWIPTATPAGAIGTGDASGLVTGSTYQLCSFTTSGYSGQHALDSSSVAAANLGFFEYLGQVAPGFASTDTNVAVLARVLPALVQTS